MYAPQEVETLDLAGIEFYRELLAGLLPSIGLLKISVCRRFSLLAFLKCNTQL